MKLLIIEDEPLVARDLEKLIGQLLPEASILAKLSSVAASLDWLRAHPAPDLILSDIQLSDGISFEIFEALPIDCPIIFTTAYNEYAIKAFKFHSIDYLLKPISRIELDRALQKYRQIVQGQAHREQLNSLLANYGQPLKKYKERFLAVYKNAMVPVPAEQICFFHKDELIFLHTMSNERLISEFHAMDELEQLLDPQKFFRANRQYIVHLSSVGKVRTTHKGLTITLVSPYFVDIDISREKASDFKKWLEG
ncbi:LytTR family DNA-binding domain-containing protein [Cytophagales bacterium LB-30]|uniref:LytTR family DNA-binding domain-containing protein n=1 Tax=Shiella aurantiaca TaxID=3058365 RepID=A0ABT8F2J8_9BACT|nr:LytTR family DNA-binding domain-containing protein [Shiella aurantiaca]MDN4164665.1 LytTR family DNA-binding domain-containing protein [Shiella aurantiaca]